MDLKEEYDLLYEEADKLFKEYDPCKFEGNQCTQNRFEEAERDSVLYSNTEGGCCTPCRCVSPNGCTVKALGCKLYACAFICNAKDNTEFCMKIESLKNRAKRILGSHVTLCYTTKEKFNWLRL